MNRESDRLFTSLERIFHEPSRLAIMSELCAAEDGLAFSELKERCDLTDGNLNRHLNVLAEEGVIRVEKTFVGPKPRTTIHLASKGLDRFRAYLAALAEVLRQAQRSLPAPARRAWPAGARGARA